MKDDKKKKPPENNTSEEIVDTDFTEVEQTDGETFVPPEGSKVFQIDEETLKNLLKTGFFSANGEPAQDKQADPKPKTKGGDKNMDGNNFEELMEAVMRGDDLSNLDRGTRQALLFYIKQFLVSGAIREDDLLEVRRQANYEEDQKKREEKREEKERKKEEKEAAKAAKPPMSDATKIAIAIGITAGTLLIIGGVAYFIKRKIDEKKATEALCYDSEGKLDLLTSHIDLDSAMDRMSSNTLGSIDMDSKFEALFG